MHIPDGFIDLPVAASAGVVAVAAIAVSVKRAQKELDDSTVPLAGMTAVFVFAAQMVNFPVAAGTSGHLMGAALTAILVGPATAILSMTVVIGLQALLFADGGLTALGLNLVNMSVVAVLVSWLVFKLFYRPTESPAGQAPQVRTGRLTAAAFIAGWTSVVAAATAFVIEYALGGTVPISVGAVATAMLGVHAIIGIVEGVITALVVVSIARLRPDLVYGLRPIRTQPAVEVVA